MEVTEYDFICFSNQTVFVDNEEIDIRYTNLLLQVLGILLVGLLGKISWDKLYRYCCCCPIEEFGERIETVDYSPLTNESENFQPIYREYRSHSCFPFTYSPVKAIGQFGESVIKKIQYVENRESQESDSDYGNGGYMAVHPGDILDERWRVCRKLGFGHFSTVWLCKNIYDFEPKYVAIKICKSALMFAAVAHDEIKLLIHTKNANVDHPGYNRIVQLMTTFRITAPNGIHTAIALEGMGPSLLHLIIQSEFRGIQVPGVKRIIYQVLQGLTYLHDACKIIHTDIKPENILIKVKESYIREMAERADRFTELGIPMPKSYVSSERWIGPEGEDINEDICSKFEEQRCSSYPNDVFITELANFRQRHAEPRFRSPMWIGNNIEIKIADMGNACWENNHFSPEIQTRQYRALEVIMQAGYSYPADIWSVGCLAFEMATGEMLFNPKGKTTLSINIDHLSLIWEVLGGIPKYITLAGTEAKTYFVDGKLKHVPDDELKIWRIEEVLVDKYKWKRLDAIPFASFIECLIEPDPALRVTAAKAMRDGWLTEL